MTDEPKDQPRTSPLFGLNSEQPTQPLTPEPSTASGPTPPPCIIPLKEAEVEELVPSLSFLIVDDVRASCDVLSSLLRAIGANPAKLFAATTLFGATNLARSHHIDVVISDLHLRVGTGLDLLEALRTSSLNPHASFMLVTNDPAADEIKRAQRMGVTAVIVKPISVSSLVEHLAFCLSRQTR